jgi:hypothetical protein
MFARTSFAGFSAVIRLAAVLLVLLGAYVAWRWIDANLLNWGIQDGETTVVNTTDLMERIQAFELVTVKQTYQAHAAVDVSKVFSAGPARVSLPSWAAGQEMNVRGDVTVTAGVDMALIKPEDIELIREGAAVRVVISIPEAAMLGSEVKPGTLNLSTSQGILTRLKTRLGFSEKDLRDQAVDRLVTAASDRALKQGILDEARAEGKRRLEAFLNGLPQAGDVTVTYVVIMPPPPVVS